ncbi:MAG: hypothetical protein JWM11_532 [Planctomycetaceae bacterium]|nr:hypothetical protein [Planctomycetaceae bacterium]
MQFMSYGPNVVNQSCQHEDVARLAYLRWIAAGQPEGRDLEFWLAAEEEQIAHVANESLAAALSLS